jgi:hypothetical protein
MVPPKKSGFLPATKLQRLWGGTRKPVQLSSASEHNAKLGGRVKKS